MNHLHRDLAPISDAGWDIIDDEAKSRFPTYLPHPGTTAPPAAACDAGM